MLCYYEYVCVYVFMWGLITHLHREINLECNYSIYFLVDTWHSLLLLGTYLQFLLSSNLSVMPMKVSVLPPFPGAETMLT